MEVVEEFFDFTIDIWRVIVRHLFQDERTTMRLLCVSSKSRKGVLTCFEWWMNMYPLRFTAFQEIKKQAFVVGDFPFFCLHFTIEAHIHKMKSKLTKLKEDKKQREEDLIAIAKTEQKLLRANPVICPVVLSKTAYKSLVLKAVYELKYYAHLRMIEWIQNESAGYFVTLGKEQKIKKRRKKAEEDSDLDYVE